MSITLMFYLLKLLKWNILFLFLVVYKPADITFFVAAWKKTHYSENENIFFFFSIFKKIYLFYFTILVLPYIDLNPPWVYMCSPSQTSLPPPSLFHPSGSSQCTSPEHPVSCLKPGLAIRFTCDILHVSMPFSQIIPPSPSPTESRRLFYTSVSL